MLSMQTHSDVEVVEVLFDCLRNDLLITHFNLS